MALDWTAAFTHLPAPRLNVVIETFELNLVQPRNRSCDHEKYERHEIREDCEDQGIHSLSEINY